MNLFYQNRDNGFLFFLLLLLLQFLLLYILHLKFLFFNWILLIFCFMSNNCLIIYHSLFFIHFLSPSYARSFTHIRVIRLSIYDLFVCLHIYLCIYLFTYIYLYIYIYLYTYPSILTANELNHMLFHSS